MCWNAYRATQRVSLQAPEQAAPCTQRCVSRHAPGRLHGRPLKAVPVVVGGTHFMLSGSCGAVWLMRHLVCHACSCRSDRGGWRAGVGETECRQVLPAGGEHQPDRPPELHRSDAVRARVPCDQRCPPAVRGSHLPDLSHSTRKHTRGPRVVHVETRQNTIFAQVAIPWLVRM